MTKRAGRKRILYLLFFLFAAIFGSFFYLQFFLITIVVCLVVHLASSQTICSATLLCRHSKPTDVPIPPRRPAQGASHPPGGGSARLSRRLCRVRGPLCAHFSSPPAHERRHRVAAPRSSGTISSVSVLVLPPVWPEVINRGILSLT